MLADPVPVAVIVRDELQALPVRALQFRESRAGPHPGVGAVVRVPGRQLDRLVDRAREVGAHVEEALPQQRVVRRELGGELRAAVPEPLECDVRVTQLRAADRRRRDRDGELLLLVLAGEEQHACCGRGGGDCGRDCDREGEPAAWPAAGADLACERSSCCGGELAAGLVAVVGVLGEGGGEEVVEGLGQVGRWSVSLGGGSLRWAKTTDSSLSRSKGRAPARHS